jgi:hypothetical protein
MNEKSAEGGKGESERSEGGAHVRSGEYPRSGVGGEDSCGRNGGRSMRDGLNVRSVGVHQMPLTFVTKIEKIVGKLRMDNVVATGLTNFFDS